MAKAKRPAERRGYRVLRWLGRLALRSQYRRIEVEGGDRVPREGPVLFVANHFQSLMDSLALILGAPRPVSFLAKSTLWENWLLRPFLDAADAIPVYRPQDRGEPGSRSTRSNLATLEACAARLRAGGAAVIFPEGVSQPRPKLMPVRTGAARIVLDLERPVQVVPTGLVYWEKRPLRGALLVRFGEPFTIDGLGGAASRREAIAATTRRIECSLRELIAEAETQGELEALRTMRVVWDQERGRPLPRTLVDEHARAQRFAGGLAQLREEDPEGLARLRAGAEDYQRSLSEAGIPPELLDGGYTFGGVARFLLRHLPLLALGVPLGWLAAILTWPLRRLGDIAALRSFGGTEDVRSVCRVVGTGLLLVAFTLAAAVAVAWWGNVWLGLAVLVAYPMVLAFHVWWEDRREEIQVQMRCFLLLAGARLRSTLRRERRALFALLEASASHLGGA